jgi:hypothetical protein
LAPPLENGTVPAVLQFNCGQQMEGGDHIQVFRCGLLQGRIEVMEHPGKPQGFQLVLEALGVRHDLFLLMTKAS